MSYWGQRYHALGRRALQLPSRPGPSVPDDPDVRVVAEVPAQVLPRGVQDRTPLVKWEAPVAAQLAEAPVSQVNVVIVAGKYLLALTVG